MPSSPRLTVSRRRTRLLTGYRRSLAALTGSKRVRLRLTVKRFQAKVTRIPAADGDLFMIMTGAQSTRKQESD